MTDSNFRHVVQLAGQDIAAARNELLEEAFPRVSRDDVRRGEDIFQNWDVGRPCVDANLHIAALSQPIKVVGALDRVGSTRKAEAVVQVRVCELEPYP